LLSDYQIQTIGQAWIALAYLLVVSATYWFNTKSAIKSAHGLFLIVAFGYAVVVSEHTEFGPPDYYYWPAHFFVFAGFVSTIYSLGAFKGEKWRHILHIGTLVAGAFVWFVGLMAIAHDWI
jgi:hypothetical protein